MKKLLYSLVVFSVLFIIGCQENSITDPVSIESINKNQTTGETFTSGVIPLEDLLIIPGGFQSYYTIKGQINFTHELFWLDPAPPAPQYYVALNLSVKANLTDESHNTFRISSTSEDNIYVFENGRYFLVKLFPVIGRNDGLTLVCSFIVTTGGIGLYSRQLAFNDAQGINKNSTPGGIVTYPPVVDDVVEFR